MRVLGRYQESLLLRSVRIVTENLGKVFYMQVRQGMGLTRPDIVDRRTARQKKKVRVTGMRLES